MRSLGMPALGAALVGSACACSAATPPAAKLVVTVSGEGQVAVTRVALPDACAGECEPGTVDGGTLEVPYPAGTDVSLDAEPASGWRFVSWTITVVDGDGHSSTTTSTASAIVVTDSGDGMDATATFAQ